MNSQSNRFFGALLLIAGTSIGAGMLGTPVLTGVAGFTPSLLVFVGGWLFMMVTGLLLLEVNLCFEQEVSIVTMAGRTLGKTGQIMAWGLFLYLFYCLMVGYLSESGRLAVEVIENFTAISIPVSIGIIGCTILFGAMIYMGVAVVDRCNRLLVVFLVAFYALLVMIGLRHIDVSLLGYVHWSAALVVVPAIVISYGFHNLVPTLTYYLHRDGRALTRAIVIGSSIPLLVYLLWELVILGIIPVDGEGGFRQALSQEDMVVRTLRQAVGGSWIVDIVEYFSLCAIVTSILGVALSLVDFLADGLGVRKTRGGQLFLVMLALAPPLVFALSYPSIFLTALRYAGGFGAVILFGIMPAVMAWRARYRLQMIDQPIVPGGQMVLAAIIAIGGGVVILQLVQELGWISAEFLKG